MYDECSFFFFFQKLSSISRNNYATVVVAFWVYVYACVYMKEGKEKQREMDQNIEK